MSAVGSQPAVIETPEAAFAAGQRGRSIVESQQAVLLALGRRALAQPHVSVLIQDSVNLGASLLQADLTATSELFNEETTLQQTITSQEGGKATVVEQFELQLDKEESVARYAITRAHVVTFSNLNDEKRFKDHRLGKLGVVSGLVVPLQLYERSYGTLAFLAKAPRKWTQEEVTFAEMVGNMLTSTIARVRAEQEVETLQTQYEQLDEAFPVPSIVLDGSGTIIEINTACRELSGYAADELSGRLLWNVLAVPWETELLSSSIQEVTTSGKSKGFESLLVTKDGHRRVIKWRLSLLKGKGPLRLFLAGPDITELREAETTARQASEAANAARKALEEFKAAAGTGGAPRARGPAADKVKPDRRTGSDRRTSKRVAYETKQRIAACEPGSAPSPEQFVTVQCRDISAGGFSFVLTEQPEYKHVVAELGRPPHVKQVAADVVRVVPLEENGKNLFLIGCRFTGRVQPEAASASAN